MIHPPRLGIVIVSYATPDLARACARSIAEHVEISSTAVVIDTGRRFETVVPGVPVLHAGDVGYAAGLNLGIRHLPPVELMLGCNADVEFPEQGIAPLLDLFERYPRLGVLGPRQVTPSGTIAHAGMTEMADTSGGRSFGEPDRGQHREAIAILPQVSGSVLIIRPEALADIGGRVPQPAHLYFEDAELCRRMHEADWLVGYSGLRTFVHHVAASPMPAAERARHAEQAGRAYRGERE